MRIKRSIMDKRIRDVVQLRLKGKTIPQIMKDLDLSKHQVRHVLYRDINIKKMKRWNSKHPDYYVINYKNRLKHYLKDSVCLACSATEQLCFHHVDPDTKSFEIAQATGKKRFSEQMILDEINKCVVFCMSCHRKLHFGTLKGYDLYYIGPIQKVKWQDNGKYGGVYYE